MPCQKCNSGRILDISGKTSDCCSALFGSWESNNYVPSGIGVGGGDYLEFKLCMDCGQVQGTFPVDDAKIKDAFGIEEEEPEDIFGQQLVADAPPPRFPVKVYDGDYPPKR